MNSIKLRRLCAAVSGALLMGMGANAMADSTDDIVNALISKGVLTEEEGALLMKGRQGEKEAAEEKKKSAVSAKVKDGGIVLESGDGKSSLALTGRVHADYRFFDHNDSENNTAPVGVGNSIANSNSVTDTYDIRRARIGLKGKFGQYYEAELSADIKTGANTSVNDTAWDVAYFNVAWWKQAQFRFGLFKMPMNLEEMTSSNNIDFMERSYVNALSPTKEIGAMIHGTPFTGITYALATSNGNGKNVDTDIREDGKDVIGRLTANFAEMMENKDMVTHVGVSFSKGDQPAGTLGVNGRTLARGATHYSAPVVASTPDSRSVDRQRLGLEGVLAYKNFKAQTEWMKLNNEFQTATRNYDLDTKAWYAEALWAITGEKYADSYKNGAFGGIKPLNDFDPTTFKGGAWEVGFRMAKFDASDYNTLGVGAGAGGADAAITTTAKGFSEAKSYTMGIKFLPTPNLRFMLNYVKTDFEDVIGGNSGGVIVNNKRIDDEKAVVMRAQWMF